VMEIEDAEAKQFFLKKLIWPLEVANPPPRAKATPNRGTSKKKKYFYFILIFKILNNILLFLNE
jgi:hypothetical protein